MSKFMNEEKRNEAINALMTNIIRNTQPSNCINVFENLINEIEDKDFVDAVIIDCNKFIEIFSKICSEVDIMQYKEIIANILTKEFIKPEKCFVKSRLIASKYYEISRLLNNHYGFELEKSNIKKISIPNINFLGDIITWKNFLKKDEYANMQYEDALKLYDTCRKIVLMYNYLPAIVKAFIQTKRRSLNMDTNSKKFN